MELHRISNGPGFGCGTQILRYKLYHIIYNIFVIDSNTQKAMNRLIQLYYTVML